MKTSFLLAACCSLATLVAGSSTTSAAELSLIRGPLENTGVDLDAEGGLRSILHPNNNPRFHVGVRGLTPGGTYMLTVDGRREEEVIVDANGRANVRFDLQPVAGEALLGFDPRGCVIAINDGTADVLSMMYSGADEPAAIRVDERTELDALDELTEGRVRLRYLEQKNQDRFILHLHALERAEYVLYVDGQPEADLNVNKRAKLFVFAANERAHGNGGNNGRRPKLEFDPREKVVDLVKDDTVVFSGEMIAQIPGVNVVDPSQNSTSLTSTGADADATAVATIEVNADAETEFSLVTTNLPVGTYAVVIDGNEYVLNVADHNGVVAGELDFSTEPHRNELLLTFKPAGMDITIQQGLTTFFTGTVGSTLTASPAASSNFELPLLNQEVIEGYGHLFFESDGVNDRSFDVLLSGLPAGNYDVSVGGMVKATVTVEDNSGVLEGSVSFDTQPLVGELLLDFDPRGQVVSVLQGSTVVLTRTLPGPPPL